MTCQTFLLIWEKKMIVFAFRHLNLNFFLIWSYFVAFFSLTDPMKLVLMQKSVGDSHLNFFHCIIFLL